MSKSTTHILCANCDKPLTNKTEVEYSQEYGEFYCNFECATDAFFDRARCVHVDFESPEELKERDAEVKRGQLHWTQEV